MIDHSLGYIEAEKRIVTAQREDHVQLDLTGLSLTQLPASLGKLTQLQVLGLNNNGL